MTADFSKAKDAATELLLSQRLYSLRIDVTRLQYKHNIIFDSMQNFCSVTRAALSQLTDGSDCLRDGCTFIRRKLGKTNYIVLYNHTAHSPGRKEFTLAHEVGHIYLGHQEDGDIQEQEANCFAAQLLAPEILVYALFQRMQAPPTPQDISSLFSVSRQAAENRLKGLLHHRRPVFSEPEQRLLKKMQHLLPDALEPYVTI